MVLFTDTVFWADTVVRLVLNGLLLLFTLHAFYMWRRRFVPRQQMFRFGLLLCARLLNMLDSIDFYGVKFLPPELSLFTVALQTGMDMLCGGMFALTYFSVMLTTAKFNRTVQTTVPHIARILMLAIAFTYNVGYMVCVIVAITTCSPSPSVGIQRVLTGLCTSGMCVCGIYIIAKVVVLVDTPGAILVRKKFLRLIAILVVAALAMLIQQVQSALAFLGPQHYQSAADYFPANPNGTRIDSYNLFAVIADRDQIVLSEVEYGFSWSFASLLRLVYVPMFIYCAYPTTRGFPIERPSHSNSGEETAKTPRGKRGSATVTTKMSSTTVTPNKEALLESAELSTFTSSSNPHSVVSQSTVSYSAASPSVIVPENDLSTISIRPITYSNTPRAQAPGSPRSSDAVPTDSHPSNRRSFHDTPDTNDHPAERRSGDVIRDNIRKNSGKNSDVLRKNSGKNSDVHRDKRSGTIDNLEVSSAMPSRPRSPSSPAALDVNASSPRSRPASVHARSPEPSPKKLNSPSNSRHKLPGAHLGHIRLVDEEDEEEEEHKDHKEPPKEPNERKPFNKSKEGFQRLNDDLVEASDKSEDRRDIENIE